MQQVMLNSSGGVNPELLRSRLSEVSDPDERALLSRILECGLSALGQMNGIDFVSLERQASGERRAELWAKLEPVVTRIGSAISELQQAMAPLVAAHTSVQAASERPVEAAALASEEVFEEVFVEEVEVGDVVVATVAEPRGRAGPEASALERSAREASPEARVRETVWAMTFILSSERDGFAQRQPALLHMRDGWELLSAVQDHVGHLQSAVTAVLTGIYASLPGEDGVLSEASEESLQLYSSRELRARLFQLRGDVLEIEKSLAAGTPAAFEPAIKRLASLLEAFRFSPAFAWMRAGDKRNLLEQARSIKEVVRLWSPLRLEPARRLVAGLARYLEALEVINRRECLLVHDRKALLRVVENLEAAQEQSPSSRAAVARALGALAEVQWRDKRLDELLAQSLDPAKPPALEAILARAREVLAELGSVGEKQS